MQSKFARVEGGKVGCTSFEIEGERGKAKT